MGNVEVRRETIICEVEVRKDLRVLKKNLDQVILALEQI